MNFMVRPSKCFLFDYLEKTLKPYNQGMALDAGCANFKNRKFFKTDKYIGLDIDLEAIRAGIKKFLDNSSFGLLGDLSNLAVIPDNSFEAVVSTNTLYVLPWVLRFNAIKNLCRITSTNGIIFLDLEFDSQSAQVIDLFKSNFQEVKVIYYKNIFSNFYEKIFERQGFLGDHPLAGKKSFRILAWLISRLEFLTCRFSLLNKHLILIGTKKIGEAWNNQFEISALPLMEPRIYYLMK